MIKKKYTYNPKTLSYEPVNRDIVSLLLNVGIVLSLSLVLAIVLTFSFSEYIDSPEELKLKVQNTKLQVQQNLIERKIDSINMYLAVVQEKDDHLYRSLLGVEPLAEETRAAGIGGQIYAMDKDDAFLFVQKDLDRVKARLAVQNSSLDELSYKALRQAEILNSQPKICPIREDELIRFASKFGYRMHPIYKIRKLHKGIDLTAAKGTSVYATAPGRVVIASNAHDGYGNKVVIDHGNGYKTVYAHLSKIEVKYGQLVKLATEIGKVGNTGTSISSHLHYEVRLNNHPIDPAPFLYRDFSNEEFDSLVALGN